MGKKPWSDIDGGKSLEAFPGAFGYRTSEIETSEDLLKEAARVFEIEPNFDVTAMAAAVKSIPRTRRRELAYKNIPQGKRARVGSPGTMPPSEAAPSVADHKKLLHQVVMAVINAGQGNLLNELPEVAAYYNCGIPTVEEVIGGRPETAIITGDITFDDRVYSFSCALVAEAA
jgi:hypothetical protein